MCTAIVYRTREHYFGRNLDLEYWYDESVTITPRNFSFKYAGRKKHQFAMIGMAYVVEGYPLYYDATNEKGLSMAGLSFEEAKYKEAVSGKDNIPSFEFIPWILSQCDSVSAAEKLLKKINITDDNFSEKLPATPLHWIIADKNRTIVVEQTNDGLKVYNNQVEVLTNSPDFEKQMFNLNNYMHLSSEMPENMFSRNLDLRRYSNGLGAMGLPGDSSSMSRFVKAAFTKENSVSEPTELESISQFFHILDSVKQQRGCVKMGDNLYEITVYSSCCNTGKGIYYYKTYENSQIIGVSMYSENLDGDKVIAYPLYRKQQIMQVNY